MSLLSNKIRKIITLLTRPPGEKYRHNKAWWDHYAATWDRNDVVVDDPAVRSMQDRVQMIRILGDEWGNVRDTQEVFKDFIAPYLSQHACVAEIGSGGGRIAAKVVDRVGNLTCYDISQKMLETCRRNLGPRWNVRFVLLRDRGLPAKDSAKYDFIYSFDVFVHFDLHMMWRYFQSIRRCLNEDGKAMLHTSNLANEGGWENFARQERYRVLTHYFVTPQTIEVLARRAGLRIVRESEPSSHNFYYNRDYLCVLELAAAR